MIKSICIAVWTLTLAIAAILGIYSGSKVVAEDWENGSIQGFVNPLIGKIGTNVAPYALLTFVCVCFLVFFAWVFVVEPMNHERKHYRNWGDKVDDDNGV